MRAGIAVLLVCLSPLIAMSDAATKRAPSAGPVANDREGRRAYDDLARFYADSHSVPDYDEALAALESPSARARQAAGRYLLRLFQQSLTDETNGRAAWIQTPYWGGGSESPAREFRERLAAAFGLKAAGDGALPALEWLLGHEPVPEIQASAAPALGRMRGPAGRELLSRLLRERHPNKAFLLEAIAATRSQALAPSIPELRALSLDYRDSVRRAAGDALVAMGAGPAAGCRPTAAFPSWLAVELGRCSERIFTQVPRAARWRLFETDRIDERRPWVQQVRGWLLAEEDTSYRVLDEFGRDLLVPRRGTRLVPVTLAEEADRIVALRRPPRGRGTQADSLSREGGLTAQFESGDLSLPEILVAAWSFERGDTASAAALLYDRLDALADERQLGLIARDLLGNIGHQRMLEAFSYDRDYERTVALAHHLASPMFDGYTYQPRARELAAQLALRQSDFASFALPDSMEWERLRAGLDRPREIAYLIERLRLLNCFQWGQPGGVDLGGAQYEKPTHMRSPWDERENRSRRLVNPYQELTGLRLTFADIPSLAPALADVRFLPTFGFWRDFHPARDLYRVCDLAASLVNDAAQQRLVDPDSIPGLTPEHRRGLVRSVAAWGRAHASASPEDVRLELLKTTTVGYEFERAVEQGLEAGDPRVARILIERFDEFPRQRAMLLRAASRAKTDALLPLARRQLRMPAATSEDEFQAKSRVFYAGLILLQHGEPEGLAAVREVVSEDFEGYWTRQALDALLASPDPEARAVLCGSARKPKLLLDRENSMLLRRLFREGCDAIADSLLARLSSESPHGMAWSRNPHTGEPIERKLVEGDAVADYLAEWRPGGPGYDKLAPDIERAAERARIGLWLTEQARRVRAREALEMRP